MIKFQRITLLFPDRRINIETNAFPSVGLYEFHLVEQFDWWVPLGVASTPDAALGYAANAIVQIAGQLPSEIWVDPAQEFVSTADTLSKLARYGIWASTVRYR